jgi:hypothetical protein
MDNINTKSECISLRVSLKDKLRLTGYARRMQRSLGSYLIIQGLQAGEAKTVDLVKATQEMTHKALNQPQIRVKD